MVEPTALRLLIPVLPIMTLYGERHFTIANSISTVLFLPAFPIVTRRYIIPKGWYVSPEKPISEALHLLSLDRMLTLRFIRQSIPRDRWEGEFICEAGPFPFKRPLAVLSSPYHVYDFYVVPSLTPALLVVPVDILYQIGQLPRGHSLFYLLF
ncbi:hypothetical protein Tco_0085242 [Tanacetum coccineum]